jgi:hypothetical protein
MNASSSNKLRGFRLPDGNVLTLIFGVALVVAIVWGQSVFGYTTRAMRLDPAIDVTQAANVIVVLDFEPERFHNERLAAYGVFSGRDGSASRIRLRQVQPGELQKLASLPWVHHVEPMR